MRFLNPIMRQYLRTRMPRILRMMDDQSLTQLNTFRSLINTSAETEWGKKHHYSRIKTYKDFAQSVPIQDYNSLSPWFSKASVGDKNVLWPGKVKWFSKSSGTTGSRSKIIPVTRESIYQCHVKTGKDLMAVYYNSNKNAGVFSGKSLLVGGSLQRDDKNPAVQIGDISAVLIHQLPEWLQFYREPSREVMLMPDWEKKVEAVAKRVMHQNITTVSGVPTWILKIFERVLIESGNSTIAEVWPNLELFVHGGISFLPYKEQFSKIVGKDICCINAYNASEGFFAFQDTEEEGMLLHTDNGIFYEFIALDETDKEFPHAYTLSEVECQKDYALVISTNAGLWRYKIGDTIRFTSLRPYRIEISGRTAQYINAFGEELMVFNAEKALSETCKKLKCSVRDYTVAPLFFENTSSGTHEWLIEFETEPSDLSYFTKVLDDNLQKVNSDYAAKRSADLLMRMPVVKKLSPGTFYRWLERNGRLGAQIKVPRLKNDRSFIVDLLSCG